MDAAAERDVVRRVAPGEIERVRVVAEVLGIVVGRAEDREDERTGLDALAVDLDVLQRDAPGELHRRVEAQELVDRVADEVGLRAQELELVGMAQECERSVPDQVDGRLVAGDEQQDHLVAQLVGREAVAFLLGGDHRGQQVVGGLASLPLDRRVDVGDHVVGRAHHLRDLVGRRERLERRDERVRPVAQLQAVGLRHAEHLGDHRERERERQVGDHVHLAAGGGGVEHPVHERLHVGEQLLDAPRRERLADEPPDPGVVGRVDVEDRPRAAVAPLDPRGGEHLLTPVVGAVLLVDRQARVAQQPGAVVVAGEGPRAERALVDGAQLAEAAVLVVGVVEEPRLEGVEEQLPDRPSSRRQAYDPGPGWRRDPFQTGPLGSTLDLPISSLWPHWPQRQPAAREAQPR